MKVAVVGEIMVEKIFKESRSLRPGRTLVLAQSRRELGGGAFNIAWYLAGLGHRVDLATFVGKRDRELLEKGLGSRGVGLEGSVFLEEDSDLLLALVDDKKHSSIYLRSGSFAGFENIEKTVQGADWLALCGGRHPALRQTFRTLAVGVAGTQGIVFSPSYAVFEYETSELADILSAADLIFLSKDEYAFAAEIFPRLLEGDWRKKHLGQLIVTKGAEGVEVHSPEMSVHYEALGRHKGYYVGAGDAFATAYLHEYERSGSIERSVPVALKAAELLIRSGSVRMDLGAADIER